MRTLVCEAHPSCAAVLERHEGLKMDSGSIYVHLSSSVIILLDSAMAGAFHQSTQHLDRFLTRVKVSLMLVAEIRLEPAEQARSLLKEP